MATSGRPTTSQSLKSRSRLAAVMALGGDPMRVPTPAMLAEYATPRSMNASVAGDSVLSFDISPSATGSIMAAVAVLLIHMLRSDVAPKSPSIAYMGFVPAAFIMYPAMYSSILCL